MRSLEDEKYKEEQAKKKRRMLRSPKKRFLISETNEEVSDSSDSVPAQSPRKGKVTTARHTVTTAQVASIHEDLVWRFHSDGKKNHGSFKD